LKTSGVSHPSYAFQLVERLDLAVSVEFEKGNANMGFGITYGPSAAITRLDMYPGAEWMKEHPQVYDGFVLKNINELEDNMCLKGRDGSLAVSMFDGWATHPLAIGKESVPPPSDPDELPSSVPPP
jgi:hypothetical protein